MEEEVMRKHIDLYVNKYSIQLGPQGKKAILQFYKTFMQESKKNAALLEEHIFL